MQASEQTRKQISKLILIITLTPFLIHLIKPGFLINSLNALDPSGKKQEIVFYVFSFTILIIALWVNFNKKEAASTKKVKSNHNQLLLDKDGLPQEKKKINNTNEFESIPEEVLFSYDKGPVGD